MITKYVDSNHYHLWTDVLHARELAKQTSNKWDRGSYVRWTVITAWIALEIACQDALENKKISYSFQQKINETIIEKKLNPLDWGQGIWQKVLEINDLRKSAVHRFVTEQELFPEPAIADFAVSTTREAIKTIYEHCDKPVPEWINDDSDCGWRTGNSKVFGIIINSTYMNVDGAIKVTYFCKGEEVVWNYLSPDADINLPVENYYNGGGQISAVRLYRGEELLVEFKIDSSKIRGDVN